MSRSSLHLIRSLYEQNFRNAFLATKPYLKTVTDGYSPTHISSLFCVNRFSAYSPCCAIGGECGWQRTCENDSCMPLNFAAGLHISHHATIAQSLFRAASLANRCHREDRERAASTDAQRDWLTRVHARRTWSREREISLRPSLSVPPSPPPPPLCPSPSLPPLPSLPFLPSHSHYPPSLPPIPPDPPHRERPREGTPTRHKRARDARSAVRCHWFVWPKD